MVFNLIPIPPLDGSKVLFAFCSTARPSTSIRPVLEQYGFLILIVALLLPARQLDRRPDPHPDHRLGLTASWWASKVRQFRAHLRARVAPEERAALAAWTTAPQLALFDSMHVADRRHGLDVVASLRARRRRRPRRAARRTPARRRQGRHRRLAAGRLLARPGVRRWVWRVAGVAAGLGAALERLRTHAETSARLAAAAGCRAADRRADPPPGRAARPEFGRAAPARRRGQLMTA